MPGKCPIRGVVPKAQGVVFQAQGRVASKGGVKGIRVSKSSKVVFKREVKRLREWSNAQISGVKGPRKRL